MFGLPWWLLAALIGLLAVPASVVIPYIGLKLWERFVERDVHQRDRKLLDSLD